MKELSERTKWWKIEIEIGIGEYLEMRGVSGIVKLRPKKVVRSLKQVSLVSPGCFLGLGFGN